MTAAALTQHTSTNGSYTVDQLIKGLALEPYMQKKPARKVPAILPTPTQPGSPILQSGRNSTLASLAGSMLRRGMSEDAIEAALQAENLARCVPPLDADEVSGIVQSIMRYANDPSASALPTLTDTGNAERFQRLFGNDVRYAVELGWFLWNGMRWVHDAGKKIMEMAKITGKSIFLEATQAPEPAAVKKHANKSLQAPRLEAMIKLAETIEGIQMPAASLDDSPMLLGVANGVIELKTGKLRAADRDDLLTRHSPVEFDPKAKSPVFDKFIDDITCGDKKLAAYLQRVIGYTLTGLTKEQCLFFLFGSGANGKSTFLNIIKEVLGPELAMHTPTDTLTTKRGTATNDLARVKAARMLIANEIEDGSMLAESLVKQMTGGEPLAARLLYKEHFEYVPKFKLFIAGNHKPILRGRDDGIWRRVRLVPFNAKFTTAQIDKNLIQKLRAELPGILNWAIKGCLTWQRIGLDQPKVIDDASAAYKQEMDVIEQWMLDCCERGPTFDVMAGLAYRSYAEWSVENGYKAMASGMFYRDFALLFNRVKRKVGNFYVGVKLR